MVERYIVANSDSADMYKYSKDSGFKALKHYNNPLGSLTSSEMREDKPGLNRARRRGSAPHSLSKEFDETKQASLQFAKNLADDLIATMDNDHDLKLQIIADPSLLGKISAEMQRSPHLEDRISWVEKNLVNVPQDKWPTILGLPEKDNPNHFVEKK